MTYSVKTTIAFNLSTEYQAIIRFLEQEDTRNWTRKTTETHAIFTNIHTINIGDIKKYETKEV